MRAPPVHPHRALWSGFVYRLAILSLAACTSGSLTGSDEARLLRNPTVPIGAITRFEFPRFDGRWQVVRSGAGDWPLVGFEVAGDAWRERSASGEGRAAVVTPVGTGILRLTYEDGDSRDLWVLWIDPDHNTAALGDPEGRFGFVATRDGTARADQIRAAEQVLDFNGYRTDTWASL
ncbi:hypothetical protein KUV51_03320 [Tateyamaria omphalii]|uniref:lipocalin family protein n=1 Tax=Tateyamaria omphalii TaxID=299262 RepID=UPI001C99ABB3|nr:lipocalin family protein [Tateyamaria omphalii]MBY5932019.1 hypothetical protein [Tateyamaria omphalii]